MNSFTSAPIFIIYLLLISCSQPNKAEQNLVVIKNEIQESTLIQENEPSLIDSLSSGLNFNKGKHYSDTKTSIKNIQKDLSKKYDIIKNTAKENDFLDSVQYIFTDLLLNEIIPYWYGTKWDFNGYTSIPNQGTIACGYFVSTTLRDLSLKINRYKLAQQNPKNEILSIAIENENQLEFEDVRNNLKEINEGLYFIGLDNHVGYFYKQNNNGYFIHSNYIENKVMIENCLNSEAFESSKYYLAKITGNKALLKKWLNQLEIEIVLK